MNTRNARYLLVIAGALTSVAASMVACAVTGDSSPLGPPPGDYVPPADAMADTTADAADADDAGACTDCEYFPSTCSDDILCSNEPFAAIGFDPLTPISVIGGRSPNDLWLAGALGAVAHFDGTSWTRSDIDEGTSVHALWLRDSAEISFAGLTDLRSRGLDVANAGDASPNGWTPPPTPSAPDDYYDYGWQRSLVSGFAAPGATWFWGATSNVCAEYACRDDSTSGVWRLRFAPSAEFEIGSVIPSALCADIDCGDMRAIHGSSADDLWAVGDRGAILHITNAESDTPTLRTFNSQTTDALYGVWAASKSDAWVVGHAGIILRYDGAAALWHSVADVPTTVNLYGVSGTSPSDIWAVGDVGTILHYDGTSWSRVKIAGLGGRRPKFTAVWAASPGHVWIGGQGVVLSLGGKS